MAVQVAPINHFVGTQPLSVSLYLNVQTHTEAITISNFEDALLSATDSELPAEAAQQ
jgi:hypothetical protein